MNSSPLRVNLGCGGVPFAGYVNVDRYAPEADIQKDVLAVHFELVEELVAYHLLEHLTESDAATLLVNALAWMRPGGTLEVETPDMKQIMELGVSLSQWQLYVYGYGYEGEAHRWGYTLDTLKELVEKAGWIVDAGHRFYSRESWRMNMPCISVEAHKA